MPRYGERPGYEERVEEGSDMAFGWLGGEDGEHIDLATGSFKAGHEDRVATAKHTLNLLGFPQQEIEDSIVYGEACVLDHIEQLQRIELLERMGLRGN
ncbi:MAG TPA: hypothetical protein VMR28_03770 [Candidatus Saccharimonadales bacterium]|jgi:hypothetical protein|nr:hypothetical protein [Candidatus Saccharimonadales bacterium]